MKGNMTVDIFILHDDSTKRDTIMIINMGSSQLPLFF